MRTTEATQLSEVQFGHGQVSKASICAIITVNMTDRQSLGDKNQRCFMIQGLKILSLASGCKHESQPSLSGTRFNKAPMSPYSKASMHFPEFPEDVTPQIEHFLKSLRVQFLPPHSPRSPRWHHQSLGHASEVDRKASGLCIL